MTTRKYSSRSQQTTLSAALTSTATTATVQNGSNLLGGATIAAGETFTVVIDPDTALEEIVDVTAVSTNTLTIVRGIETAGVGQAHSAGAVVRHMIIGRDLREANTHVESSTAVHGLGAGSAVVGTTDTQTLTNKTLTDPVITGVVGTAGITFEGSTADAYETTLTVTDPTADRTITFPNATGNVILDTATQTLSNKTLGTDLSAGGFKITNLATPTNASDAVRKDFADAQVAAAATSATSAATSASSAATSASSAATSASAAATSASSAATSATSSATSATASATSASAAATSASSASASATAAATSASSASTSASDAATSASSASTSASSASTSASSAATSASSAATSASAAATSATSAAASAALLTDSSIQISFQVFG